MNILHTITLTYNATGEEYTRHIIRPRRLTYTGALRILRNNGEGKNSTLVRIETAICR